MTKTLRNRKSTFAFLIIFFIGMNAIFSSCNSTTFPTYPPGASCTFGIPELPNFDCYTTKIPAGRKIKLFINIRVTFLYQSKTTEFSNQSISVTPVPGPLTIFPAQLAALIPSDNSPYEVEVNVQGDECSTCANGYSDPAESPVIYGNCPATTITTTNPWTYRAAKPRWTGGRRFNSFQAAYTFAANDFYRILNTPYSCGCTVN
jgi:hypothetical protein